MARRGFVEKFGVVGAARSVDDFKSKSGTPSASAVSSELASAGSTPPPKLQSVDRPASRRSIGTSLSVPAAKRAHFLPPCACQQPPGLCPETAMVSCNTQTHSLELTSQEVQTTESEEGTIHLTDDGRAETRSTLASIDQRLGDITDAVRALPGEVVDRINAVPMQPDISNVLTTPTQHDIDTTQHDVDSTLIISAIQQIEKRDTDCNKNDEDTIHQEHNTSSHSADILHWI